MDVRRDMVFPGALLAALLPMAQPASQTRPASSPASASSALGGDPEHGRYLVERVAMCVECHSGRDPQGTILPGSRYMGGEIPFRPAWGTDWATRAPRNAGLTGYTDEQAMRLLTQGGIGREGSQLKAPMPRYRMTPQDAADVIAFMRSQG